MGGGGVRYAVAMCEIRAVGCAMTWVKVEDKRVDVMIGTRGDGACRCMIKRDPIGLHVRRLQAKDGSKRQTFSSTYCG